MLSKSLHVVSFTFLLSIVVSNASSQTVDMVGPTGSGLYGLYETVLSNGNYVVTDPGYSEGNVDSIGAVYLYNGSSNALISTLKGSSANDMIGFGVTPLKNGNYVVRSPYWHNASVAYAGAVTWCNGNTGLNALVLAICGSIPSIQMRGLFLFLDNHSRTGKKLDRYVITTRPV
jgi:hypothetical protein